MPYKILWLCFVAFVVFVVASPSAQACSFQVINIETTTVEMAGETTTFTHYYYAWVGCGSGGSGGDIGPVYDPWPPVGHRSACSTSAARAAIVRHL